jgi:hypothetical protein
MIPARTRQEIFDLAYRGLAAQGFRRSHDGTGCLYRGPHGLRCAIGHCIPDDEWEHRNLERVNNEEIGGIVSFSAGIADEDLDFAQGLQEAHDDGIHPSVMRHKLEAFAHQHGLTVPEVTP